MTSILAARRSPVAPKNGALAALAPHELVAPVLRAVLADAGLEATDVGEVVLSNALGPGGNVARVAALAAGLPERVAGLTIDRQCAGGLDAVLLADAMIRAGMHDVVIAGGVESCSRRPLRYRTNGDGRAPEFYDQAPFTPWPERDPKMVTAAARLAETLQISRDAQDAWAIASHRAATAAGPCRRIVALGDCDRDPFTRALAPKVAARAPVIEGSITAANMAVAADGAGLLVVVSDRFAAGRGAQIIGGRTLGADAERPGLAPLPAIRAVLQEAAVRTDDLAVAAIMEAFAVQAIGCQQGAELPREIVNPFGGALARGHPIGASGAILAVDLIAALDRRPGIGLAAIAAAGGIGSALLLASGTRAFAFARH
ncbi:thiolase family protein [Jiella sp. MQZ9-1]|uniref:Thiolase family protein n=1 Tax=Jiella flava TaxID=2816857 RepID=A0A939G0N4_9HYPH|nr:thiolase family protein [Jiella flava]MBO0662894.1 thiolase family protein [Jiella flava]MCD2471346.1 thiolase family protein [Jiella flava]